MIRLYQPNNDFEAVSKLLEQEGVIKNALNRQDGMTLVLEKDNVLLGFYTFRYQGVVPHLIHFVVKRESRLFGAKNALSLVKHFELLMKRLRFAQFIINLTKKRKKTCKVVNRYFKGRIEEILSLKSGKRFYLVRTAQ